MRSWLIGPAFPLRNYWAKLGTERLPKQIREISPSSGCHVKPNFESAQTRPAGSNPVELSRRDCHDVCYMLGLNSRAICVLWTRRSTLRPDEKFSLESAPGGQDPTAKRFSSIGWKDRRDNPDTGKPQVQIVLTGTTGITRGMGCRAWPRTAAPERRLRPRQVSFNDPDQRPAAGGYAASPC